MAKTPTAPRGRSEARRLEILQAAATALVDHGYAETRIAEVARRAQVSTALLIYYFGTREQLLCESLRSSDTTFYQDAEAKMAAAPTVYERLDTLLETCFTEGDVGRTVRSLWLELWAQAQRHADMAETRASHDQRWRDLIGHVVREGQLKGEVLPSCDARRFAVSFNALLDGLMVQVGLGDNEVSAELARDLAIEYAVAQLGLTPPKANRRKR